MKRMDALNIITGKVLTAAFRVHSALGPGLLESAYQACLAYELHQMRLKADVQVALPVTYDQIRLEVGYRLDIVVEQQVILELKAVNQLLPIHEAQLLSYFKIERTAGGSPDQLPRGPPQGWHPAPHQHDAISLISLEHPREMEDVG